MKDLHNHFFKLSSYFEATPDLVCIAGKDGFFQCFNNAVQQKLGYSDEELFSLPIETFIHPEDRVLTATHREKLLMGHALINFVNRYVTKLGSVIWLEWSSIYFSEQEVVFAIAKDVSERKLAELAAQEQYSKFKGLALHFKNSIEQDKKYIAYELHEEVAQLVAAIKMDVEIIAAEMEGMSASLKRTVEHAQAVCGLAIKSIQRVAFSVSPKMLDDFGIDVTLQWLCNEFAVLNDMPVNYTGKFDEGMVTNEVKIDIFRICQEVMLNLVEGSGATYMQIRLLQQDLQLTLSVLYDGAGIDVSNQKHTAALVSIRERAASTNAQVIFENNAENGTSFQIVFC